MNRKIDIQLNDAAGKTWKFTGSRELYEFLKTEAKYWKEQRDAIKDGKIHNYMNMHSHLSNAVKIIENWNDAESWDEKRLQQEIGTLNQQALSSIRSNWLWSGHPLTRVFVECHKKHNHAVATAFIEYVIRKNTGYISNSEGFLGTMIGYEFINQDSAIPERRDTEKAALEHLRNQLDKTTRDLINEVEAFKNSFNIWRGEAIGAWKEWINKSSGEHSNNQGNYEKEFGAYIGSCKTKISDLENLYHEKLRLEAPALYWEKAARKYGIQGGLWSLALVASILLGIIYFSEFFSGWIKAKEMELKLSTIQGIVIFATILAIYAFLVKTISRLTFSTFHLMRDAEEREQLTYLYLSLINEKKIDERSRDIILQALFSRSETGLLPKESGPTMPTISEITKFVPRS